MTRKEFLRLTSIGAGAAALGGRSLDASTSTASTASAPKAAPPSGVTDAVVGFVAGASFDAMPNDVRLQAKRCLIDGLGCVLAGATARGSAIVRDYVKASGGRAEATLLGPEPMTATAAQAALANGASGHAMDYDDTQLSTTPDRVFGLLTHPTVPVLSASLALGERLGVSGRVFLEAFLTGFEVECKIAEAINPDHYLRGFHSTGTIGTLGAAASAAKLLGLDRGKLAHTLGIAASMSSGIRVNFGSMTKPLHAGRAAENGIVAAELASRGFTAGDVALDGEWGFFEVFGGGADLSRIVGVLGRPYSIVTPGVSVKPYPCGSLGHPTMDAMMKLVTDHDVKPEQVKHVSVRAGSNILNPLRYKTAKTELEAKFCLPFMMSAIILRRRAGIREFTDAIRRVGAGAGDDDEGRHGVRSGDRSARLRQDAEHRRGAADGWTDARAGVGRPLPRRAGPAVHARGAAREVHRLREPAAAAGSDRAFARGHRGAGPRGQHQGARRGAASLNGRTDVLPCDLRSWIGRTRRA